MQLITVKNLKIFIKAKDKDEWIWNSFDSFILYKDDKYINDYDRFLMQFFLLKKRRDKIFFYL